jgi:hypothetical protein
MARQLCRNDGTHFPSADESVKSSSSPCRTPGPADRQLVVEARHHAACPWRRQRLSEVKQILMLPTGRAPSLPLRPVADQFREGVVGHRAGPGRTASYLSCTDGSGVGDIRLAR